MKANTTILLISLAFFFIMVFSVVMHEQVHSEIYRSYGIDSEIHYFSEFPDIVTIGEKPCPNEICELAHHINEAVTYNTIPYFMFFGLCLLLIIFQLERLIKLKEEEIDIKEAYP
jgi:hypothetical protein